MRRVPRTSRHPETIASKGSYALFGIDGVHDPSLSVPPPPNLMRTRRREGIQTVSRTGPLRTRLCDSCALLRPERKEGARRRRGRYDVSGGRCGGRRKRLCAWRSSCGSCLRPLPEVVHRPRSDQAAKCLGEQKRRLLAGWLSVFLSSSGWHWFGLDLRTPSRHAEQPRFLGSSGRAVVAVKRATHIVFSVRPRPGKQTALVHRF